MRLLKRNLRQCQIDGIIYKTRGYSLVMTRTADLLRRLSKEGILVPQEVKKAMLNVDLEDLRNKSKIYSKNLAALKVTYPSTH